ncbi:uncharacterized protein EDB91DRAFT_1253846 [Suillus paluster]|uniref:uncharacterized protein n=1 Tax=Suillus paluster TaxID=48578 RepID=UPI001B884376|nr:uncharacterized protein EDB91DRAFT_1253846 [Suillus paluster]KAG1727584.1 hypothetical protein EDB91DRAFT_1253846 [Suillus paluster]
MAWGITKKITSAVKKLAKGKATTASASALMAQREEARQTLLKAKGMRSQYDGHLVQGCRFLADMVKQKKTAHTDGTHTQANGELVDIDAYSHAFNNTPNRYSASMLELFLVQKGLMEARSLSTMWEELPREDLPRAVPLQFSDRVVTGNPAQSAAMQDMMEVLKNNEGAEGGSRNHASAMTIEDMWKSALDMDNVILAQKHLVIRAFATTGFMIWTRCIHQRGSAKTNYIGHLIPHRNVKLTKIRRKDIVWNCQGRPPYDIPYDLVSLLNHKGWQRKGETDGALDGHEYEIYPQQQTPEICMFTHLRAWVNFLEKVLLRWPLEPDEFIFARVGANSVVYASNELSYDGVMKMLAWMCKEVGLTARYTTHCFQRGGARYQFMFTPLGQRWSLATIRWWGAWAEGKSVDTLIRDALCPIPREADKSFNGDHILTAPVTAAETQELKMSFNHELNRLSDKVKEVLDKLTLVPAVPLPSPPPSQLARCSVSNSVPSSSSPLCDQSNLVQPTPFCEPEALHAPSSGSCVSPFMTPDSFPIDSNSSSAALPPIVPTSAACLHNTHRHGASTKKATPIPGVRIPDLPRGLKAWCAAVKQWEDPVASIGGKALKDWPEEWYTGPMRTITGVKRNIRKVIGNGVLPQDEGVFLKTYPEATRGVKLLFDAIQCQRKGRGEITG